MVSPSMIPTRSTRFVFVVIVGLVAASCSSNEVTIGGSLDVQLSSNSPVLVGDSLELNYAVQGRSLLGMVVEWGDAGLDSLFFSGAQTADGRVRHLYQTNGAFTVIARVVDQVEGSETKTLTVTVDP